MDRKALNNEVILMRKSLKSIYNQTKLNLSRKIAKLKKNEKQLKSAHRKESELEALKRLSLNDIKLYEAVDGDTLKKVLTNPISSEVDRASARILLSPIIQKNIQTWKSKYGPETVETFLTSNHENIQKGKERKVTVKRKQDKKKLKKDVKKSDECDEKNNSDDEKEEISDRSDNEDPKPIVKLPQKRKAEKNLKTTKPKEPKVVQNSDPFFVDSKGDNYVASVSAALSESESSEDDHPKSNFSRGKKITQKLMKKPIQSRKFDETPPSRGRVARNEKFVKPVETKTKPIVPKNDDNIHPSWKAKAEQKKQQMVEFQGTKIKFDD